MLLGIISCGYLANFINDFGLTIQILSILNKTLKQNVWLDGDEVLQVPLGFDMFLESTWMNQKSYLPQNKKLE